MSKSYVVTVKYTDGSDEWKENIEIPDGVDSELYIRELLEDFNEEERRRYKDKAKVREFVSIDTDTGVLMCSWTRANAVVLTDSTGMYNLYHCPQCELTLRTNHMSRPPAKRCYPERVCTICNREFASELNLTKHIERMHSEEL